MSIDYFTFAAEQARRYNAKVQASRQSDPRPTDEPIRCPACGADLTGHDPAVARDGREDETCGSADCRRDWYA